MAEILQGSKTLMRRFAALERNARTDLRAAVLAGGLVVRDEATRLAPETDVTEPIVLSEVEASGLGASVDIGHDKEAWFLSFAETGTKFQPPQPHLRPAIDRHQVVTAAVGRPLLQGINAARRA